MEIKPITSGETKSRIAEAFFSQEQEIQGYAPFVQPVFEVGNKVAHIAKEIVATNATSATIYTTPADQDFYLTNCTLSVTKDATATSIKSGIYVSVEGVAALTVATITGITLTAQQEAISCNFYPPIKIDRNYAITVRNSTNVGNITTGATIQGYLVNPYKK